MRSTDSKKILASFAAILALLLVLTGFSYRNFRRLAEADRHSIHTYQVLLQTAKLARALVNMETGVRGYVVVGDERFLEPFKAGQREFRETREGLLTLTGGQEDHGDALQKLQFKEQRWLHDFIEPMIMERRGATPAAAIVIASRGALKRKQLMDEMRGLITDIEERENKVLVEAAREQQNLHYWTMITFVAGSIFSIAATLILAVHSARSQVRLESSIQQLHAAKSALETEVQERQATEKRLADLNHDLQRSNAELEQFAYVASHDLQEPLRAIGGCVQVLQRRYEGKLDDRADQFIQHAVAGATRMQSLINDLLVYSRVGTVAQEYKRVELDAVLNSVCDLLRVALRESEADITHDILPAVWCDEGQISLVLQNFVGNAIKFRGDAPPCIHVGAREDKERHEWIISVTDQGIGIEPEYFERIWVMFQRLHTRAEYAGTGIGLAICKKIIERHGGRLGVESKKGEGSTFWFSLPAQERMS